MDNIVDSITALDANIASLLNKSANIVVVAATGIERAVTTTDVTVIGTPIKYKIP